MSGTYYKQRSWDDKVAIYKRAKGGDRMMARGMSDVFAARVVRLLNDDEDRSRYAPLDHPVEDRG
jgi:hypothetical protein